MAEYIVGNDGDESILDLGEFELRFQERERIVRCRDCIYYDDYLGSCVRGNAHQVRATEPDGFCKLGERK